MSEPSDNARQPTPDSKSGEAMRASLERALSGAGAELSPPLVPDHALLRRIGSGAYGEVWLARNALGTLRAVKVVSRARFKEDRPYEREFHGILKYEPISRSHEGLVQVLHVGRGEGCFYYVMELADSVISNQFSVISNQPSEVASALGTTPPLNTDSLITDYSPRTLCSELASRPRLPPVEAAQFALRLASALAHLHAHGLVHRDIKPSNVIFVGGLPKLADIGLVTDVGSSHSFVGTEGFIPPEGPGTRQADLYALGKVLYELATGRDRMDFPQLPPVSRNPLTPPLSPNGEEGARSAGEGARFTMTAPDSEALLELNEVMTRACAPDPKHRYASATELQADLNLFLAGRSLRHARSIERTLARLKNFAAAACVFLALAAGALWFVKNEERHANERARQADDRARAEAKSRAKETELRQRAETAEHATQQQLYAALLEQARATVRSGEVGQRVRALDAIHRAAAISNSAELRREVFAALALPDLRFERELPYGEEFTMRTMDPSFERIALCRGRGPVEIRSAADDTLRATLPASTNLLGYHAEWSVDGRYLAVKRDYPGGAWRGDWEIWEVAASRRVLLFRDLPRQAATFHPRLPRILVGRRTGDLSIWNLEDGREILRLPRVATSAQLEFAPNGEQFAASHAVPPASWAISLYDATSGLLLVSNVFPDILPRFKWHPTGRWLAAAGRSGAVHWMDSHTGESRVLGRHKSEARWTEFSPDGAYLITGGWEREMVCWDARTLRRAFGFALDGYVGWFRADSRALALETRTGVQQYAFERPSGYREFAEDLGAGLQHAAFSSDGRWLAAAANGRMGLWDLTLIGPGALDEKARDAHLFFTPDGRELFGSRNRVSGDNAGFRWRISPATDPGQPPRLERLALHRPAGFASLSLSSNSVVMTSTNGTQVLAPGEVEAGNGVWKPTYAGINRVSPDGRWMGMHRHYSQSLYVHGLPGLERVARLTQLPQIGSIHFFEFSPLADEVALYSARGVELWSTATWERTRALTNFSRPFLYAPDGRSFWLTRDYLRAAGLYDRGTLEPRLLLPTGMLPVAASPDGRHLAVSVQAQRLQVWDLAALRAQFRELGLDWAEGGQSSVNR